MPEKDIAKTCRYCGSNTLSPAPGDDAGQILRCGGCQMLMYEDELVLPQGPVLH